MLSLQNLAKLDSLGGGQGLKGLRRQRIFNAPLTDSLFASGKGSTTPTFTRASTAYVQDYERFERAVLTGEARFHGARRIRNQFTFSQDFTNAAWAKNSLTNSTYTGLADPFGGTSAARIVVDNGASVTGNDGIGSLGQTITKTASVAQTVIVSIYAKAGEAQALRIRESTSSGARAVFNLVTGEVTYENSATALSYNAQMLNVGNGWYRCSVRFTTSTGATQQFNIKGCGLGTSTTGDGASGLFIAFAQLEDETGQALQCPSEYTSTNVLSAPFHGANVDGVQYSTNDLQVEQNLARYSSDLTNTWAPTDATVAATGELTPLGEPAFSIADNANNTSHRLALATDVPMTGTSYTATAYIKAGTKDTAVFRLVDGPFTQGGRIHISSINSMAYTEVVSAPATMSSSMTDEGNGWRKVTVTVNFSGAVSLPAYVLFYTGADTNTYIGTGQTILAGSVQLRLNSPSVSTAYVPTTARAIQNVVGLYRIPPTTALGFYSEIASTNLTIRSEEFDNASWLKTDTTITANNIAAPDGYTTAELCTEGVAGTASLNQGTAAYTANNAVTFSVYLKRGNTDWIRVTQTGTATPADSVRAWFNLATGAKGSVTVAGAATQGASEIRALNNGWYRCSVTYLPNAAETTSQLFFMSATADASTTRVNNATYYAWGAQSEIGNEMTSYTPTQAATAIRNSDYLFYTNVGNVNDAQGTVYHEVSRLVENVVGDRRSMGLSGNTITRMQAITNQTSSVGTHGIFGDGASTTTTVPNTTGLGLALRKHALTWRNGVASSAKSKVNATALGTAVGTPSVTSTGIAIGSIMGNGLQVNGTVRNFKIYRVNVTDNQLNNLTA